MATAAAVALAGFGVLCLGTAAAPAAPGATKPTCEGLQATIVGNNKNNIIHGTPGDDVIVAGRGDDKVYGAGGNDVICGGYGADQLYGGPGNDFLAGEMGRKVNGKIVNDVLEGDAGDDILSPGYDHRLPNSDRDRITFVDSPNAVTINSATHSATGNGNDRWLGDNAVLAGSRFGDTFNGGPLTDFFDGGAGADTLYGNGGDDVLRDDHSFSKRKSRDTLSGGPGNDRLFTYGGFDTLLGGDGNDLLSDYRYDAGSMQGGSGDDVINDGLSPDAAQVDDGGLGLDKLNVYIEPSRSLSPRLSIDLIQQTGTFKSSTPVSFRMSGTELVYVHNMPLTFIGDAGNNLVWTDGTADLDAWGNAGNDVFIGGFGNDTYDGGSGSDRVLDTRGGKDTCTSIETVNRGKCG